MTKVTDVHHMFVPVALKPIDVSDFFKKCREYYGGKEFSLNYDFPNLLLVDPNQIMGEILTAVDKFNSMYSQESTLEKARLTLQDYGFMKSQIPGTCITEKTLSNFYENAAFNLGNPFWKNTTMWYSGMIMDNEYVRLTRGKLVTLELIHGSIPGFPEYYLSYRAGRYRHISAVDESNQDLSDLRFWKGIGVENRLVFFMISRDFYHLDEREPM